MADINKIIAAINNYLEKNNLESVEANEVAKYLDRLGLLSFSTKGQSFRKLLREGKIPNAEQPNGKNTSWYIRRSSTGSHSSTLTQGIPSQKKKSNNTYSGNKKSEGLAAIEDKESEILILGTLPGEKSLELGEYYSNPSNKFWEILSKIYKDSVPTSYYDRVKWLLHNKIALWDILKEAVREGSLDSNIQHPEANNLIGFISTHPHLRVIAFNGSKSQ